MKKKQFRLTVYDHRKRVKRVYTFEKHKKYLRAMRRLANEPQTHVSETTETTLHVYPAADGALFEGGGAPKGGAADDT